MKRILSLLIVAAAALSAQQPATGVKNTMHDLSSGNTGVGTTISSNINQICIFCHTPHNSASQIAPLWNHTTTTATFTPYTSGTLNGTFSGVSGNSLACLSCHDGTLSVGALANFPYGVTAMVNGTSTSIDVNGKLIRHNVGTGGDLTSDHPISITYQDDLDSGLVAPASLTGVKLFPTNTRGSKVECASCHDVHNWNNSAAGGGTPFLRVTKNNSTICFGCHIK
jgi:hypothetical protein